MSIENEKTAGIPSSEILHAISGWQDEIHYVGRVIRHLEAAKQAGHLSRLNGIRLKLQRIHVVERKQFIEHLKALLLERSEAGVES